MAGTNAGSGHPLTFKCAMCRRESWRSGTNLTATGLVRDATRRSIRQSDRLIQYHCNECGHTGWTQHIDAERLLLHG